VDLVTRINSNFSLDVEYQLRWSSI